MYDLVSNYFGYRHAVRQGLFMTPGYLPDLSTSPSALRCQTKKNKTAMISPTSKSHRSRSQSLALAKRLLRTRHRLKVALVQSWSATTGGLSRFESELRCGALGSHPSRLE